MNFQEAYELMKQGKKMTCNLLKRTRGNNGDFYLYAYTEKDIDSYTRREINEIYLYYLETIEMFNVINEPNTYPAFHNGFSCYDFLEDNTWEEYNGN